MRKRAFSLDNDARTRIFTSSEREIEMNTAYRRLSWNTKAEALAALEAMIISRELSGADRPDIYPTDDRGTRWVIILGAR
jgi:hypothetical protein